MATPEIAPNPKKRGPVFWIIIGVCTILLLLVAVLGGFGYYAYRTVVNAGITPELMKSNPKFAAHKMVVVVNKDLEIVSENPETDDIIVRSKSKGTTLVHKMNVDGKGFVLLPAPLPAESK